MSNYTKIKLNELKGDYMSNPAKIKLYDFINELNKYVNIGYEEYSHDFDSQEFKAIHGTKQLSLRIAVIENSYNCRYYFGLENPKLRLGNEMDNLDEYDFKDEEIKIVIENYLEKVIKPLIEYQQKKLKDGLDNLNIFLETEANGYI